MSLIKCDECDHLIDSDTDPDCFGLFGSAEPVLCKYCREASETPDQEPVGQAIESILMVLDCFMAKANHPLTVKEIEAEAIGIGQILSRAQLILGFLEARKQPKFKVISNGKAQPSRARFHGEIQSGLR